MAKHFNYLESREIGRRLYLILSDLEYQDVAFGSIVAKRGFVTNYASIDVLHNALLFIFYALLASYGDKAATIHDWLYSGYGIERLDGSIYYPTRQECDEVLYRALRAEGVARWRAYMFYAGVRVGGSGAFNKEPVSFNAVEVLPNVAIAA